MNENGTAGRKISVLVAEDSDVVRALLVHLVRSDDGLEVVGEVADGQAALEFVQAHPPDVVLMDIHMPRLNGFEATRRIMETRPVPIVVCSATANTRDMVVVFQAMEAGAIACIEKPLGSAWEADSSKAEHMVQTLKLMSEVKVVRRTLRAPPPGQPLPLPARAPAVNAVGIGASTGGPTALQIILAGLPAGFAAPILVVQHMTPGFVPGLVAWLDETTPLDVEIAADGVRPLPGHVYIAPDGWHMGLSPGGAIALSRDPPENHLRPAVSFLFRALARVHGANAIGVILTGMGCDGAGELQEMKQRGAITIAQDEASSAVYGMPGVAIEMGAASLVLAPLQISEALAALVHRPGRIHRS